MTAAFGSVSNSFGGRSIYGDVGAGQTRAQTVASGVIGEVNRILGSLEIEGNGALNSAISAIGALGAFSPGTISVSYSIPSFSTGTYAEVPVLSDPGLNSSIPEVGATFSFPVTDISAPPDITSVRPDATTIGTFTPPSIGGAIATPILPNVEEPPVPAAPTYTGPTSLVLDTVLAPELKALTVPDFVVPEIQDYEGDELNLALPDLPSVSTGASIPVYSLTYDTVAMADAQRAAVHMLAINFSDRLAEREQYSAVSAWAARGQALPADVQNAQQTYRADMTKLMAAGEQSRYMVDRFGIDREFMWIAVAALRDQHRKVVFEVNTLNYLKASFEYDAFTAGALIDLYRSAASLYNAYIAQFRQEVELYKAGLRRKLAELSRWRAEVDAESSKTQLNRQMAQNYAIAVEAESSKTALYKAEVDALYANVAAYRARMEGFAAAADAARTEVAVYKGRVDSFIAALTGYRAEFQNYSAQMRGVIAENQLQEAKTQISMADMQAAGASAQAKNAEMEIEAAGYKLEARRTGAEAENAKLKNALEAINAQIQGDRGRIQTMVWGANLQRTEAQNDAISSENQAAARYYNAASDSAYRASEQAYRAMMALAQASTIAQEAAGRTAASVAQGAYSAVHVSASLQGAGRLSGEEDERTSNNNVINDWLDDEESRQQIISA